MSTTEVRSDADATSSMAMVDMKLEVIVIPVSDVDRAREFYANLGWRFDGEFVDDDGSRSVQLTPSGSGCSVQFGTNVTPAAPGSAQAMHLVVADIEAAREQLVAQGVAASQVYHCATGYACRYPGHDGRVSGRHPDRGTYGSFVSFDDPDGNGWVLQEVTKRLPGRVTSATDGSVAELTESLQRAATAHGKHESEIGEPDPNWPEWYAQFMVDERTGQ